MGLGMLYVLLMRKGPKYFASRRRGVILFGNEKYPKVPAHSPTLKVGFAAEAILQVAGVFAVTD